MPLQDLYSSIAAAMENPSYLGVNLDDTLAVLVASSQLTLLTMLSVFLIFWNRLERQIASDVAHGKTISWGFRRSIDAFITSVALATLIDGALLQAAFDNPVALHAQRTIAWLATQPPHELAMTPGSADASISLIDEAVYLHAFTLMLHGTILLSIALCIVILIGQARPGETFRTYRRQWFVLAALFGIIGSGQVFDTLSIEAISGNTEPLLRALSRQ